MSPERARQLLVYDPATGVVKTKRSRTVQPDHDGLVVIFDNEAKKSTKIKLDKLVYMLIYGEELPKDYRVLHRNMQQNDNSKRNITAVHKQVYLQIKEAYRNLLNGIQMKPHPTDQFEYVVSWYEDAKQRQRIVRDVVPAKKLVLKLQLKFSKILTQYCVFDEHDTDLCFQ